ncbi:hypothetical protein JHD49_11175 [Sulfurimonas sp. SAG-AH-194-C21]|nr:hypothetical protein [Sulfurimonas sp. SAG-AH-194-C21]MDF1884502.1 hypothetical protein [Sulfurimonas sp. SAG-AH-194-C21]
MVNAEVSDKWKINVGGMFVTNFETEMNLSPKNLPIGVKINTKDQLGMENDTGVFRLDGYYRFTDTQSIDISYFSVRSDGGREITQDIEWDGDTISAGAKIQSYFDMDVYKINYAYSFYHTKKVELALTAGLHITTIDLGLGAVGVVNGTPTETYSSNSSTTIPLPVIGFKGEYTIIDKCLFVTYKTDYFFLDYDGLTGSLISSALNLEYRFVDNVGVGVGYNANRIYLKSDDGDRKLEISNDLSGAQVYFTYIY